MGRADEQRPWLSSNYEKILVCIVFAIVFGSLGYLIGKSSHRPEPIPAPPAVRPGPPRVDGRPYHHAMMCTHTPGQLNTSGRLFTVPETRVACLECSRPVPIEDFRARKPCPWPGCNAVPPPPDPRIDRDKDKMHDVWEKENGLDPTNSEDARGDLDDDGFTNLEEFLSDTDPRDVNQCPLAVTLRVEKILSAPFRLVFTSAVKLPDGSMKFGINAPEITYFKKLGEEVEGYKIIKHEPRKEKRNLRGVTRMVDMDVLTLQKDEKVIPLTKDRRYSEYEVQLRFHPDDIDYKVMRGSELEIRRKAYRVIGIDDRSKAVILERADGKRWTIVPESPPPRRKPE